jgi:histidyl-tRNA synthetase
VFREVLVYGLHPREQVECAFDVVTPSDANLAADAEVLAVADNVLAAVAPAASADNFFFRWALKGNNCVSEEIEKKKKSCIYRVLKIQATRTVW